MAISAIKQNYILKSVLFISFLSIVSLGLIGGCSDNGGGQNSTQALTENDFTEDSALRADLEKGVIVTFLEAPNSEAPEKDTSEVGIDEIPVTYQQRTEQTFCWEDDETSAMHFMELINSEGSVVLIVHVNGDCVTQVIEAGDYLMSIHHDGRNEDSLPIFLRPNPEDSEQTRETNGLIDRLKLVASNILKRIERTVTKDAKAQTVMKNIDTLISTKNCDFCNLLSGDFRDADLFGAHLDGADLRGADFTGAILESMNINNANLGLSQDAYAQLLDRETGFVIGNIVLPVPAELAGFSHAAIVDLESIAANLTGADFSGADVLLSDFRDADFGVADFRGANLFLSDFSGADLRGGDFRDADLRLSNFSGADLRSADFRGADLTAATFSSATWCDGCICAVSLGGCGGCPPVEEVCTGP